MDNHQVVQIMIALSDNINPITGEIYGKDSPYRDDKISEALLFAADSLSRRVKLTSSESPVQLSLDDEILYDMLRSWRLRCSIRNGVKIYQIFSNETLRQISYYKPLNDEQLMKIKGVGATRARKYGADIFDMIEMRQHMV